MSKWNDAMERFPIYGKPVLLKINGVNQDVTYTFDCADNGDDPFYWFEPYHFEHGFDEKMKLKPGIFWRYVFDV